MNKGGRPLIQIDWKEFDKLCGIHCTLVEIAEWFNCSEDTIERAVKREKGLGFAEYYKKKSSRGKMSLRRKMFELAQQGNVTMCIWLSKNMLGYTDKVDNNVNIERLEETKRLAALPKEELIKEGTKALEQLKE